MKLAVPAVIYMAMYSVSLSATMFDGLLCRLEEFGRSIGRNVAHCLDVVQVKVSLAILNLRLAG